MKSDPVVLLVDSTSALMKQVPGLLRDHDIVTTTVALGLDAITRLRSDPPALVLLPYRLPDTDPFELLAEAKRCPSREVPVIFVGGGPIEHKRALRLGAADVLSLPLLQEEVVTRVKTHLQLAALRDATRRDSLPPHETDPPALQPRPDGAWITLAMRTGKMYGFDWDAQTDEVHRTQSCVQVLAGPADAAHDTGQNWFRRVHPDDVDQLRRVLSILSPAYDAYDTKYRVQRSDGRWITIHESSRGFFDAANRLIRVSGVVIDVTEQVRAERELMGMQLELLKLMDKLPIAVALTNEYGWFEYLNESFRRTFGYQLLEIARPDDWWRQACPDEQYRREVMAAWGRSVADAETDGRDIPPQEYFLAGKDGTLHIVQVSGAVLGNRKLILFDDITERKRSEAELRESEARFRLMADNAPVMLWVSGTDKLCTFFNKGWLDYTGRTLEQELGNGWAENVHPEDLDRCVATYEEAFDARRRFQMEYRLRRADGDYGWILDIGVPRFDKTGAFAGYIGSGLDLTDFKRQQERMLAVQKLESLGVVASSIAHDFSNLLGCILVDAAATLSELVPGSPAREGLERIESVAVRASEFVRQIMAYASEEQPEMEPVDLASLVQEMLRLLQVGIPKNVSLDLNFPSDLPAVRGNAGQLRQVIMNLVLNAEEAFGDGHGVIRILARREHLSTPRVLPDWMGLPDGEYVRFEISDNGTGMTEDVRSRIFDPFFTTKIQGRGLGLPAVQRIVHGHGGAIDVVSTPGVGTRFEVLLPSAGVSASSLSKSATLSAALRTRSLPILIVEDEDTLRFSVSRMLLRRGFSVLEAADGDRALDLIDDERIDMAVVLLDLTLPGKSSLEVLKELQRVRPDVKVILTSAYVADSGNCLRSLRYDSFIRKPYQVSELISVVRRVLFPMDTPAPALPAQSAGAK
jgi:PAS domain S-box-containing protein